MANDYNALGPWVAPLASIRVLRSTFTVVISVLLLNCLIALLNLKVEAANQRVSIFCLVLHIRQFDLIFTISESKHMGSPDGRNAGRN